MNSYGDLDESDVNGQGCLQHVVAVLLCVAAICAAVALGRFAGLDATLEGDATIYALEPVEHCSLQPEP